MKAAALAKRTRFAWVQSVAVAVANRFARPKNMTAAPVCVYDGPPTCGKLRKRTIRLSMVPLKMHIDISPCACVNTTMIYLGRTVICGLCFEGLST
jgi:hypothetical protein